jgi:hypothetical protein
VRTFTVKVRVSNLPGLVSTRSIIKRRNSALTVVTDSAVASPKITVTL